MSVTKMLKGHELFQSLSFEEVGVISTFSGIKDFDKDETIFESGGIGSHFFVVQDGCVNLRLPAEAHEASLVVGRMEKGDIFGLAPLLGAGRHTTTAQCAEPCKVLTIEAAPLRALLDRNPLVGLQIMGAAARAYFTRYVETLRRVQKVVNEIAAI
jgi:CRP/FNR family cyclic AMP-dependent transcriptional regulator